MNKINSDRQRLAFEFLKHISTLDTASILVVLAIEERIAGSSVFGWKIAIALLALMVSLFSSFVAIYFVVFFERFDFKSQRIYGHIFTWSFAAAVGGLAIGLLLIFVEVYRNLGDGTQMPLDNGRRDVSRPSDLAHNAELEVDAEDW